MSLIYYDISDNVNEKNNLRLTKCNPDVFDFKNQLNKTLKTHANVNYDKPKYFVKKKGVL